MICSHHVEDRSPRSFHSQLTSPRMYRREHESERRTVLAIIPPTVYSTPGPQKFAAKVESISFRDANPPTSTSRRPIQSPRSNIKLENQSVTPPHVPSPSSAPIFPSGPRSPCCTPEPPNTPGKTLMLGIHTESGGGIRVLTAGLDVIKPTPTSPSSKPLGRSTRRINLEQSTPTPCRPPLSSQTLCLELTNAQTAVLHGTYAYSIHLWGKAQSPRGSN